MVDVSGKQEVFRTATARAVVEMPADLRAQVRGGELSGPKGPVFQTAIISATMAAKETARLIPYCHPIPVERCHVEIQPQDGREIVILAEVATHARTGVEMEALTAAAAAALTIYDMCKGMTDGAIVIRDIRLLEKRKAAAS